MATEGRVSPVRSQCQCDVLNMSSRSQCYYRKKAEQAIEGVLKSIAPGNASCLYQQVMQRRIPLQAAEGIVEDTLVARLVILYEEAPIGTRDSRFCRLLKEQDIGFDSGSLKMENQRGKEARFPN